LKLKTSLISKKTLSEVRMSFTSTVSERAFKPGRGVGQYSAQELNFPALSSTRHRVEMERMSLIWSYDASSGRKTDIHLRTGKASPRRGRNPETGTFQ